MLKIDSNGSIHPMALPTSQKGIPEGGCYSTTATREWQTEYVPYPSEEYSDKLKDLIRVRWEGIWEEVWNRAKEK